MALLSLKSCTDASLAEFIRLRYDAGEFQQAVNNCYILVNPFHQVKKESDSSANDDPLALQKYLLNPQSSIATARLFQFQSAVHSVTAVDRTSQTVIFRGCCGSGKTEALKSTIQFLLCANSLRKDVQLNVRSLAPLGSQANPFGLPSDANRCAKSIAAALSLYDIMGNSITENNSHSSRHLKHIKLVYDGDGKLYGAQLTSMLTDLMRFEATSAAAAEAAQPQNPVYLMVLVAAGLGSRSEEFKINKTHRDAFVPPGVASKAAIEQLEREFEHFHTTLLASGAIDEADWNRCLRAVAACINLQCVVLSGSESASISMSTKAFVANAEELLGLTPGSLTTLILKRPDDRIGRSAGSLVENKPAEGKVVLDALSRLIYGRTYKFCLQHCSMQSFPSQQAWLDDLARESTPAPGFTDMHLIDVPGWEQLDAAVPGQLHHLLLHYVEEKLHADYIGATFIDEMERYALEEVDVGIVDYPDCGPNIDVFEKPSAGIIFLLEEASQQIKANDRALLDKILVTHLKTKLVKSGGARASATAFLIKHSFADIMYECEGFITQNKQSHLPDMALTTLGASSIPFVAVDVAQAAAAMLNPSTTAPAPAPGGPADDASKRVSVGRMKGPSTNTFLMSKTRNMMNALLEKVAVTDKLTYALCLTTAKSSKEGGPALSTFAATEFLKDQCKYFALPQLVTFVQKGFSYSQPYAEFYKRFRGAVVHFAPSMPAVVPENERLITVNAQTLCRVLVQHLLPLLLQFTQAGAQLNEEDEPVYGQTCLFIRDRLIRALDEYRLIFQRAVHFVALSTQAACRMRRVRAVFGVIKRGTIQLQSYVRARRDRRLFVAKKSLTNKLKALYRMSQLRRRYVLMREAINFLKSKFTGEMIARIRYKRLQRARRCLQGLARGFLARHAALRTYRAMLTLQRAAMAFLLRRRRSKQMLASALKVQNRFRGFAVRVKNAHFIHILAVRRKQRVANKVVRQLQALWRGKLVTKRFREVFDATIRLQAWVRKRREQQRFAKLVRLVLWLQCTARRIAAHNRMHALVVTRMVQSELGLLADLFKREVASIAHIPIDQRVLSSGYLRNGVSQFKRYIMSFDVNFDLSFAYPNGWLATLLEFSRGLKDQEKSAIVKVVTGSNHTVILDDRDNIYTWGLGDVGQLGHNNRLPFPRPQKIEKLTQYLASATTTSSSTPSFAPGMASLASPTAGRVGQNIRVKDLCCGRDHTLLLTASGVVYSWGDNRRGQLGHSKYEASPFPKLVGAVMSKESTIRQLKHVRMICCGDYHSACLVEPGFVYTWGRGQVIGRESRDPPPPVSATSATPVRRGSLMSVASQGSLPSYVGRARASSMQLHADLAAALAGAGAEGDSCQPEVVSYFHRRRVQHICSGEGHLIARSGSELFAWGDNRHGQLGDGTTGSRRLPVPVQMRPFTESEANTAELVSGGRHNVLLIKGEIWSWGWNKYGAVGNGSIDDVLRPTKIPILGIPLASTAGLASPSEPDRGAATPQFIVSIDVGLRHTLALSSSQLLFGWGMVNLTNPAVSSASPAAAPLSLARGPSCENSMASSSTRRFSVHCDSASTSELYLSPAQIFYAAESGNPFSGGKFLQLRGCCSSSLGFTAIDAEVPLTIDIPTSAASVASARSPLKASSRLDVATDSPSKAKLASTANAVRRALLFTSPAGRSPTGAGAVGSAQSSLAGSSLPPSSPKPTTQLRPQFNPFLKDYSNKKDQEAALAKKFRELARATKFIPGATATGGMKSPTLATPESADFKSSTFNRTNMPSAEAKASKRPSVGTVGPNRAASVRLSSSATTTAGTAAGTLRRTSSASTTTSAGQPPAAAESSHSPVEVGSMSGGRSRLRMSLTRGVYAASAAAVAAAQQADRSGLPNVEALTVSDSGPVRMLGLDDHDLHEDGTAEGSVPFDYAQKEVTTEDLLDLFSPLHLSSIRAHRGQRKRDVVRGSTVRDYFAVFEQRDVPLAPPEDSHQRRVARAGITASGVGMPKTEKTFLEVYEQTKKGSPMKVIHPGDGQIAALSPSTAQTTTANGSGPSLASYQTPTLSYSWRLASRRKSTSSINLGQGASASTASASLGTRSTSPSHGGQQRDWSPPPRRASTSPVPGTAQPATTGANRALSPKRPAGTSVDPVESLGIDKAIEKLTRSMGAKAQSRTNMN